MVYRNQQQAFVEFRITSGAGEGPDKVARKRIFLTDVPIITEALPMRCPPRAHWVTRSRLA